MPDVYPTVIRAIAGAFRVLGLQVTVTGAEHVPERGPAVLAANHSSFLDFAFMGLAGHRSGRLVRFLARHDVWEHRVAGPLMRSMRHIPVDRAAPAAALLAGRAALDRGEVLGVFPEAGVSTSFTVRPMMPGAVALAAGTQAPLIPMAIWGPQRILTVGHRFDVTRGRPVRLLIGAPIPVRADLDVRDQTVALGGRLAELLERAQRTHPDQPDAGSRPWWHPAHLGGAAPTPERARRSEPAMPAGAVPVPVPLPVRLP